MKQYRKLLPIILLVLLSSCRSLDKRDNSSCDKITKAMIYQRHENIENAFKAGDVDKILSYMDDNCKMTVIAKSGDKSKTLTMDSEQYREQLKKSFETVEDWNDDGKSEIVKVEISNDCKTAKVISKTIELGKYQGYDYRSENTTTIDLEIFDNVLKSTSVQIVAEQSFK